MDGKCNAIQMTAPVIKITKLKVAEHFSFHTLSIKRVAVADAGLGGGGLRAGEWCGPEGVDQCHHRLVAGHSLTSKEDVDGISYP